MAKRKQSYQPVVSYEVATSWPSDVNGWQMGFSDLSRIMRGGNGTLVSYSKAGVTLECGRSGNDYYVLATSDIDEKTLGWSDDIGEMIRLLADKLNVGSETAKDHENVT